MKSDHVFTTFVGLVKLEQPRAPNQLFANYNLLRWEEAANTGTEKDIEEDPNPVQDGVIKGLINGKIVAPDDTVDGYGHQNNLTSDGDWNWTEFLTILQMML